MYTIKRLLWPIRSLYYRLRFVRSIWKYLVAPWEWPDAILHVNMQILLDFYNHGKLFIIDWSSDFDHCNARIIIEDIYEWYTITYPQREKELKTLIDIFTELQKSWWEPMPKETNMLKYNCTYNKYSEHCMKLYHKHLDLFEKEKEEMLHKLMSIRNFLWT